MPAVNATGDYMKIVCLLGSPRPKGNSTAIAKHLCSLAEEKGATVQTFALNKLNYRGCQACMTCKTRLERCVLKDDLIPVLDSIRETDVLVLASPVYYGDVSSQLKAFVDRTYSYLKPGYLDLPNPCRLAPGKILVFILAQGAEEAVFSDIFPKYSGFFKWYGFAECHLIRACSVQEKGEAEGRDDIRQRTEQIASSILSL